MSAGLKALLDAAQYIEHQENLKRSPQDGPQICYIEQCSTINGLNNNSIIGRNARNAPVTVQQVSSSAPASCATFQHINNGVIIANNSGMSATSQHRRHLNSIGQDYEFRNGNIEMKITPSKDNPKSSPSTSLLSLQGNASSLTTNGRLADDCVSKDEISSVSSTPPKVNMVALNALQEQKLSQQHSHEQLAMQAHNKSKSNNNHHTKPKSLRFVDSGNDDIAIVTAAANKQMLLNGGLRIASPAATIAFAPSKAINIPKQQQQTISSIFSLISSTSAPHSVPRYKTTDPLTPPPVPCRKIDEMQGRIRSFSLSSHKIPATHLQLHNGDSNDMIVEDGRGAQCVSSDQSPTRHVSGSQYFQILSSQHISGGSQNIHLTPVVNTIGRRRTISSNSNGAGTREVHNKLEKNRRAHLKECYEQLKNELPLKEDERKKTSNLAILGEALKYVKNLKKKDQELEVEVEQLAKTKINSQRKLVSLKRELGPKYEQIFPVAFPDFDLSSSERENANETGSLSSGRGSILYSSSSSLSSGGSNGSTTMSSPVSASVSAHQTALPTAISPVISKINSTNSVATNLNGGSLAVSTAKSSTSNSPNTLEPLEQQSKTSTSNQANDNSTGPLMTATSAGPGNSTVVNINSTPLSLTTNNVSVMSLTRESPTPSTPSPSPSGSSCVSSSSSLISTSPPGALNGVINGRNITVSISNNLRLTGGGGIGENLTTTSISAMNGNGRTTSTTAIIDTSQSISGNATNTNNGSAPDPHCGYSNRIRCIPGASPPLDFLNVAHPLCT